MAPQLWSNILCVLLVRSTSSYHRISTHHTWITCFWTCCNHGEAVAFCTRKSVLAFVLVFVLIIGCRSVIWIDGRRERTSNLQTSTVNRIHRNMCHKCEGLRLFFITIYYVWTSQTHTLIYLCVCVCALEWILSYVCVVGSSLLWWPETFQIFFSLWYHRRSDRCR